LAGGLLIDGIALLDKSWVIKNARALQSRVFLLQKTRKFI